MRKYWAVLILPIALAGCGESAEKRQSVGYRDGYAVAYNTTCEIRATIVEGAWDDKNYSRGYAKGMVAGIIDCNAFRKREKQ
jgi:hypothetical protein